MAFSKREMVYLVHASLRDHTAVPKLYAPCITTIVTIISEPLFGQLDMQLQYVNGSYLYIFTVHNLGFMSLCTLSPYDIFHEYIILYTSLMPGLVFQIINIDIPAPSKGIEGGQVYRYLCPN